MKIRPKKSLGQNFLIDNNILNSIADLGEIDTHDTVLEIGPGTGNLTSKLINKNPKKIVAVEKDNNLCSILQKKFEQNKKVSIINKNIMGVDEHKLTTDNMIIFGNLPYNISTQILVKWIKLKNLNNVCKKMILMFQKEVADRIIASSNTKDYGRISILSSWRFFSKKIYDIEPDSFYPKPKVKSSVIIFKPREDYFKFKNVNNLEYNTNIFFNQRRKMIKNPLKKIFKNPSLVCKKIGIDDKLRPQNLSSDIYFRICKEYEDLID